MKQSGFMCNKCEFLYEKSVSFSGCKLFFTVKCAIVTEALYNCTCIVAGEMDDFHWTYRSCKSTFPSLQNISASLEDFKGKYDYRMTNLEEKVNHIELTTKQEVTSRGATQDDFSGQFFRIFESIIFCFVVAICDLVHAVGATYCLPYVLTTSGNLF